MTLMTPNTERVHALIAEEAVEWFVANRTGLTAKEGGAFSAWLRTSPVHVEEYLQIAALARDLPRACELSQNSLEELIAQARAVESGSVAAPRAPSREEITSQSRKWGLGFVLVAIVLFVGGLLLYPNRWRAPSVPNVQPALRLATKHGEQRREVLADGSILHLNTDSSVELRFSSSERRVDLLAGEAFFEVAHQTARPFRVQANGTRIAAMGTRFDVYIQETSTIVIVTEGRVGLARDSGARSAQSGAGAVTLELAAGREAIVGDSAWPPIERVADVERATAWLHHQISFDHEPLQQVVLEFNRYTAKPIVIKAPQLRSLEISGVFSTDDVDAFVAFLSSLDGVRVDILDRSIEVSLRKSPARGHNK
jgi:transmembrane sensor